MKRILLFMVYYGTLPNYFDIWLESVKRNPTINFCIISDCIPEETKIPDHIKLLRLSFEQVKTCIQDKFDFPVSIENYGRISQFRPALAYVFPDELNGYDYWGFVECDLILGDIRAFITDDILMSHDKLFKLGHFQIFENNEKMRTLFMQEVKCALSYKFAFTHNILFFEEILGMHNIANAAGCKTYSKNIFADIKCYEYMFCKSDYGYDKEQEKTSCLCFYNYGKLYCCYIEHGVLKKTEILYVHFQKRSMDIMTSDKAHYLMLPNQFADYQEIDETLFETIYEDTKAKEKDYQNMIKRKLSKAKKMRYRELCWWKLKLLRCRIKNYGGTDLDGKPPTGFYGGE